LAHANSRTECGSIALIRELPRVGEKAMSESVYKVIEVVGTSSQSWEAAAATAVERASQSLRDLRIAEVVEQDVQIRDGKIELYRAKLKLSFKFEEST
jgi:flavin-binding protein dodecin